MDQLAKVVGKPCKWQSDDQNIFDRLVSENGEKRVDLYDKVGTYSSENVLFLFISSLCHANGNQFSFRLVTLCFNLFSF